MMMLGNLVFLFIAVPILELALLVWIGQQLGIVPTTGPMLWLPTAKL